jgi:hypothetical protein
MQYHHLPLKDLSIDIGLFMGTIMAIFIFGVATIPYFPVK